jgi:hypothetical protein
VHYPEVEQVVLVLDQLNTHSPASLYAAFPAAEAKRLADKLELHHTPKHGSWLNIAEIELSALERATSAWADRRNAAGRPVAWQFTTADARTKLRRL